MHRRDLIGVLTSATAVSLSGCASLSPAGTASGEAALSVEDSSLEVTSSDGVLDEVRIYTEVDFRYSGWQDHEITGIGFDTKIDGETTLDRVYSINHPDWLWADPGDDTSGSGTYRVFQHRFGERDRIFLFEDAQNYDQSDLMVDEPGETRIFELDLDIEMRLVADEDDVIWTGSDEATLTISHTHEGDGDGNTGDNDTAIQDGNASMGVGKITLAAEVDGEVVP